MNFLKKTAYLVLLGTSLCLSGQANEDVASVKEKPVSSFIEDESSWSFLIKELGSDKFLIEFPKKPGLKVLEGGGYSYFSEDEGIDYFLRVHPQNKGLDIEKWAQEELDLVLADSSIHLLQFLIDETPYGLAIDKVYQEGEKVVRVRKMITSDHLFSLSSEGNKAGSDRFFKSFEVFQESP